jgi:hypothetical protein
MSKTNARTVQETRFNVADGSSWTECPSCESDDVDVVVRRESDESGALTESLSSATIVFECPNCDADSATNVDEDASDESGTDNDVVAVLKMIPPLFDSDAPAEKRFQGGLVLATLVAIVGYWVYLTVM